MSQVEVVGVDQESPADEARAEAIDRPQVEAETVVEVPSDQMGQQEQCEVEASVVSEEENAEPVSAEESNAGEETVEAESVEPVTAEVEDTEVEIAAATSGEELSGEEVSRKDEAFRHKDVEVPRPSNENGLSGDDSDPAGFHTLGLSKETVRAVEDSGYTVPTPIQAQTIPHTLAGSDVLGCAQTGTGKTAAFALPVLHRLSKQPMAKGMRVPRCLVLCPARELAIQIGIT